ncbi:RHS repeat-associated core domain-containing protein [Microbacterium chocolatum]|uniref:RHS repeat-associated core domain-containing protein n=1 Tax=Microbacterium aurantiacum TaxID=162393 RepID=UPI00338EFA36
MRVARACITAVLVSSLIVVGGVTAPANAVNAASAVAPQDVLDPEVQEALWTPPEDAVGGAAPEPNPPAQDWAPGVDADQEPDKSDTSDDGDGIAPEGEESVGSPESRSGELMAPMAAPAGTEPAKPGLGELPWFAFQDFNLWERSTVRVNLANGNVVVKANDSEIAVPGFGLRQDRFYNGLDTASGSLGGGWKSNNTAGDVGVIDGGTWVDYYAVNGAKFRFTASGSSFTAPNGSNLTLRKDVNSTTARYVVESNKTAEKWKFSTTGWLTSTTDRNNVGESYSYTDNRISAVTHTNGRGYNFTYTSGRLTRVTDTGARAVDYTYDSSGRLRTVKLPGQYDATTYTYDSVGRLSTITAPSSSGSNVTTSLAVTTLEYDASHRVSKVIRQVSSSATVTTQFTYNAGETVVTDPNGNTSKFKIDGEGRVTETYDGLNRKRSQTWTANSDVQTTTDALAQGNQTVYTYDGNANQTRAQLPTGAAASAAYAIGANCSAPNTGTAFQPKCSTDAAGNTKQYQYDASGNLTKQTNTTGGTSQTEFENTYDNANRSVCGGFAGQICSTKDGRGKTTSYTYDTAGNMTKITPPSPMGATTYTYDSMGRVTSTTDGNGQTVTYGYDQLDRVLTTQYPSSATITTRYFPGGLIASESDGIGTFNRKTYSYDRLGRLLEYKANSPVTPPIHTYTYDGVGNMLSFADRFGATTSYTYDAANQLSSIREPNGTCPTTGNPAPSSGCVMMQYDNNGNETKRIYPGGAVVDTARDRSGRPTRITGKGANGATAVDIAYSFAFPGTNVDQTNVQVRTAHREQGITNGAATTYTYDSRNRLTKAEEKSGSNVTASWAYSYDGASNRTRQVRSGSTGATAGTINYTYNDANQITSATGQSMTWSYDGAGQQTQKGLGGQNIAYNDRLQAASIGETPQTYLGVGNNDRRTSGNTTYETGALGLIKANDTVYTRTPDGSAIGSRSTSASYYATDHLGSVVGIFSDTGAYLGGYSYSPYGEPRSTDTNSAVTGNILRYIGGELDSSGLYKLGARYYDTSLGRFTQMDPSGQETNPYGYAACNPTNRSDPSGLYSVVRTAVFGLATGLGTAAGGCVVGAIIGSPVGPPGAGAGCVFGALTGFIAGAVGGVVTDVIVQGFGY